MSTLRSDEQFLTDSTESLEGPFDDYEMTSADESSYALSVESSNNSTDWDTVKQIYWEFRNDGYLDDHVYDGSFKHPVDSLGVVPKSTTQSRLDELKRQDDDLVQIANRDVHPGVVVKPKKSLKRKRSVSIYND